MFTTSQALSFWPSSLPAKSGLYNTGTFSSTLTSTLRILHSFSLLHTFHYSRPALFRSSSISFSIMVYIICLCCLYLFILLWLLQCSYSKGLSQSCWSFGKLLWFPILAILLHPQVLLPLHLISLILDFLLFVLVSLLKPIQFVPLISQLFLLYSLHHLFILYHSSLFLPIVVLLSQLVLWFLLLCFWVLILQFMVFLL